MNGVAKSLPYISGHRDPNPDTECPGGNLYDSLPAIRTEVKGVIDANATHVTSTTTTVAPTTTTTKGRKPR